MKAFENWWEKYRASKSPHTCQSARDENLAALADKEIWKAALEWVLSKETRKPLLGYSEHKYVDSIVIRNELKKELEE